MKYTGQGKKNNIVIRRNPEFSNDTWKPTLPLTDKMAVEAVTYFQQLKYDVKWISVTEWNNKEFN
jgi:hypothetical protein